MHSPFPPTPPSARPSRGAEFDENYSPKMTYMANSDATRHEPPAQNVAGWALACRSPAPGGLGERRVTFSESPLDRPSERSSGHRHGRLPASPCSPSDRPLWTRVRLLGVGGSRAPDSLGRSRAGGARLHAFDSDGGRAHLHGDGSPVRTLLGSAHRHPDGLHRDSRAHRTPPSSRAQAPDDDEPVVHLARCSRAGPEHS